MSLRLARVVAWIVVCFAALPNANAQPLLGPPGVPMAAPMPTLAQYPVFVPPPQPIPPTEPAGQTPAAPTPAAESLPMPAGEPAEAAMTLPSDNLADLVLENPTWYARPVWLGATPWDTSIELGLNGSSGTSESLSIQAGSKVLRESRFSKLDLDTKYNRTTKSGEATQNNAELDVRNDWLLDDKSPWTLYATGNLFYDEFQAFDLQTSANTGVGYRFFHRPLLELIGRFGGGASREIGGPDDRWVPESLLGAEYTHSLSVMQKVAAKVDYYPEWDQIGEFRLLAEASWETALVHPSNVSLKLAASDRYDSTPGGADPHLVNYSVLLLIKM